MTLSVLIFDENLFGAGVVTHWFNSGASVPWLRPGAGAVLTQGYTERSFGWRGLDLLSDGLAPSAVVDRLLSDDPESESRQLVVMSVDGTAAIHTGSRCIPAAGSRTGDGWVVAGNLLADEKVLDEMADALVGGDDLQQRILNSLSAGEAAGGDLRGSQSAALRVAALHGAPFDRNWVELVVADHEDPVSELARLVPLEKSYRLLGKAMDLEPGAESTETYLEVDTLTPELGFWQAIGLAKAGAWDDALHKWEVAHRTEPEMTTRLLSRQVQSGVIPTALAERLLGHVSSPGGGGAER